MGESKVHLALMPEPKPHVAPLWKFVPVTTAVTVAPRVPLLGFAALTIGGGGLTTVAVMNSATLPVDPELSVRLNLAAYVPVEIYV